MKLIFLGLILITSLSSFAYERNFQCEVVPSENISSECRFWNGEACASRVFILERSNTSKMIIELKPSHKKYEGIQYEPVVLSFDNSQTSNQQIDAIYPGGQLELFFEDSGWKGSVIFMGEHETFGLALNCNYVPTQSTF
ncbi:MAG: hypothetical protein R2827_00235 [Bdellovibrionales bacterium]